ncbi:conserved exported hypothetical protein [Candidatus Zixiibacteriota bacterium]|nr:conserved exported hypothetical protein [candidate division Zixibacteria bacterium]
MKVGSVKTKYAVFLVLGLLLLASLSVAQTSTDSAQVPQINTPPPDVTPVMPGNLAVRDNPDDAGHAVVVTWDLSVDDHPGGKVTAYKILRSQNREGGFAEVGEVPAGSVQYIDNDAADNIPYYYKVLAVNSARQDSQLLWQVSSESNVAGPVEAKPQWFDFRRLNVFIGMIILCGLIIYYINQAKSGKKLFIRKIAGLDAVDEAVGRATEMGKKIFYIPGTSDMDNVQTIAGITILGRVAQLAAEYETWIEVPVSRSLVMVTAKEIVKEAYTKAGRPDTFRDEQVHYLTDDQFGYAAGIDGMVVREKPATIFFMGNFYAESLILSETGNSIGAIQIAGTGQPSQLPFFVAACDYTLIGEELFAASAYLSREPKLLGSLKGQDIGKAIILAAILVGVLLESFNLFQLSNFFKVIG